LSDLKYNAFVSYSHDSDARWRRLCSLLSAGLPSRGTGILMANTLHFIQEQQIFLKRLRSVADRFLIVEYERSKPNRWGPYPVGFERLHQLCSEAGMDRVEKLTTRPSLFGGTMYSAFAERSRTQS
jgi:hypothetical protein